MKRRILIIVLLLAGCALGQSTAITWKDSLRYFSGDSVLCDEDFRKGAVLDTQFVIFPFYTEGDSGVVLSVEVKTGGAMPDTVRDSFTFDSDWGKMPKVETVWKSADSLFALVHLDTVSGVQDGRISTYKAKNGYFGPAAVATTTIGDTLYDIDIVHADSSFYIVGYCVDSATDSTYEYWVKTYNIGKDGAIIGPEDSLRIRCHTTRNRNNVVWIGNEWFMDAANNMVYSFSCSDAGVLADTLADSTRMNHSHWVSTYPFTADSTIGGTRSGGMLYSALFSPSNGHFGADNYKMIKEYYWIYYNWQALDGEATVHMAGSYYLSFCDVYGVIWDEIDYRWEYMPDRSMAEIRRINGTTGDINNDASIMKTYETDWYKVRGRGMALHVKGDIYCFIAMNVPPRAWQDGWNPGESSFRMYFIDTFEATAPSGYPHAIYWVDDWAKAYGVDRSDIYKVMGVE